MNKQIDRNSLIKDMLHANGEGALVRLPYNEETWEEYEKCTFAFFPGCRLGAIEPEFVLRTYDTILSRHPDTAIFLHCCGFAAEMADDIKLRDDTIDEIKRSWIQLGKPVLITACATCAKVLKENLPEISTVMLDQFLEDPVVLQIAKLILNNYAITNEEKSENRLELKQALLETYWI